MAAEREPQPQLDEFFLGDLVSVEHGDCSIVAANANQLVHNLLASCSESVQIEYIEKLFDLGADLPTDATDIYKHDTKQTLDVGGEETKLLFISPYFETYEEVKAEQPDEDLTKRRRLLGRKATQEVVASPTQQLVKKPLPPQIIALIGEDIYFPLASFDYREDKGGCSYIQLGREMEDENYYVTPADEKGFRHEVVMAIRSLAKEEELSEGSAGYAALKKFSESELERYNEVIDGKREAEFVRRCAELMNDRGGQRLVRMIDEGNQVIGELEPAKAVVLDTYFYSPSGRKVHAMLLQPNNSTEIILCAETRAGALPLITMSVNEGIVEIVGPDKITGARRKALLQNAREIIGLAQKPIAENYKSQNLSDDSYTGKAITKYLSTLGLIKGSEAGQLSAPAEFICEDIEGKIHLTAAGKTRMALVHGYLENVNGNGNPETDSRALVLAVERMQKNMQKVGPLLANFKLDERLDNIIGPTDEVQEKLFEKIIAMSKYGDGTYQELLKDIKLRSGSTGDVDLRAEVSLDESGKGNFTVRGLPFGQPEQQRYPYISLDFDVTRPLFIVHPPGQQDPKGYAANLLSLVQRICPTVPAKI